ncbi:MAG: hypothetical protein WBH75_09925 [Thermoanaerobaculia bacterium]
MKRPHLLRVSRGARCFEGLVAAAKTEGMRVGWLMLEAPTAPGPLAEAAALGVLRAVAVGEGRTIAVKPVRGEPVLEDLLREHFLGCRLVLVAGDLELPRLEPDGEDWVVTLNDGSTQRLTTAQLVARLRKPHPFTVGE